MIWSFLQYAISRFIPKKNDGKFLKRKDCAAADSTMFEERVSVVIPTKDRLDLLIPCVESIEHFEKPGSFEIIVIDNNSSDESARTLSSMQSKQRIKVVSDRGDFNFARLCNTGAGYASADYLFFLNNDTLFTQPHTLQNLLQHFRDENQVAVVGPTLLYPDGSIQHIGTALKTSGIATHVFAGKSFEDFVGGPTTRSDYQVTGITFAAAMVQKETYNLLGGLDQNFPVGLNDVDFCLRALERGFLNVVCTGTKLIHLESKSRAKPLSFKGAHRVFRDLVVFFRKWPWVKIEEKYFS